MWFESVVVVMIPAEIVGCASFYDGLGFGDSVRIAITISSVVYLISLLAMLTIGCVLFVRFIKQVDRERKEDGAKALSSIQIMRAIRTDMIQLKTKKFMEKCDREEAAPRAPSVVFAPSGVEAVKKPNSDRRLVTERKPSPHDSLVNKSQDEANRADEVKTSKERDKSRSVLQTAKRKIRAGGTLSSIHGPRLIDALQSTQSLESTGSTQRSKAISTMKPVHVAPGVIRMGASTIGNPGLGSRSLHHSMSRVKGEIRKDYRAHEKSGKLGSLATDKTMSSMMNSRSLGVKKSLAASSNSRKVNPVIARSASRGFPIGVKHIGVSTRNQKQTSSVGDLKFNDADIQRTQREEYGDGMMPSTSELSDKIFGKIQDPGRKDANRKTKHTDKDAGGNSKPSQRHSPNPSRRSRMSLAHGVGPKKTHSSRRSPSLKHGLSASKVVSNQSKRTPLTSAAQPQQKSIQEAPTQMQAVKSPESMRKRNLGNQKREA